MKLTLDALATTAPEQIGLHHGMFRSTSNEDVLLLVASEGDEEGNERVYNECTEVIEQALLDNDGTTEERLDGVLKELNGLVKGLLLSKGITDFQAIIAVITEGNMLYVSHAGRAEAYVMRGGSANQITEYSKGKPNPAFVHIASGQLEPGDTVLFSTERLLRTVTPANLVELSKEHTTVLDDLKRTLETEKESACLAMLYVPLGAPQSGTVVAPAHRKGTTAAEPATPTTDPAVASSVATEGTTLFEDWWQKLRNLGSSTATSSSAATRRSRSWWQKITQKLRGGVQSIQSKGAVEGKKLHLLLLAGVIALFLIIWLTVNISSFAQSRQAKAELTTILETVEEDLRNAENRRLTGDNVAATTILDRAEENVKQVINHESRLFTTEASDLLQRIQSKREEVSNIVRRSPILAADLAEKKSAVQAIGLIGKDIETFVAYDKQDSYKIISNTIEDPKTISEEELVLIGTNFERYGAEVYGTTANGVIEMTDGKPVAMKTDDENGWTTGVDMETFNRFLYILSPSNNQIYKYERLTDRYGFPVEYNVNGNLNEALDMTIDFFIYVLLDDGSIVKLSSGETVPFGINQAPDGLLEDATKMYKVPDGRLYVLDSSNKRVIVLEIDPDTGDATYLRQFVIESDQLTELVDLYVDDDESWLFVLDEKRIVKLELNALN